MTTPLIKKVFGMLDHEANNNVLEKSTFFDISEAIGEKPPAVDMDLLAIHRPPFEFNIVVFSIEDGVELYISIQGDDPTEEGILVDPYMFDRVGNRAGYVQPFFYRIRGSGIQYNFVVADGKEFEPNEYTHKACETLMSFVSIWYAALERGCDSHKPFVVNTFTNKRKIAKGKRPLYEWRTVKIAPTKPQAVSESRGGTHASPRLHDRRGHLRRLRSGKNVWVKPCKVGNAALGTVFHDYEVVA